MLLAIKEGNVKKLTLIFASFLLAACEPNFYRVYKTPQGQVVFIEEASTSTTSTITIPWCEEYQPFPYDDVPGIQYQPVSCSEDCCLWQFESHYSMCEEYWCNYGEFCGWELKSEGCYPI